MVVSDNRNKAQPPELCRPTTSSPTDPGEGPGTGIDFTTAPGQSKCCDGMRIWYAPPVRDGVFDGGWASSTTARTA